MSSFTTQVKYLLETGFDVDLKNYPIFDENYRDILNKKILDHYYLHEIGYETAGLFKNRLNVKMNEIMPYYNSLYKTTILEFNPLYNTDYTENFERKIDSQSEAISSSKSNSFGESNTDDKQKNLFQDTPQGELDTTDLESQKWATNLTLVNGNSNNTTNSSSNIADNTNSNVKNLEDYIRNVKGFQNTNPSKNLEDFRKTIINIDMDIINDLNELFMQIW